MTTPSETENRFNDTQTKDLAAAAREVVWLDALAERVEKLPWHQFAQVAGDDPYIAGIHHDYLIQIRAVSAHYSSLVDLLLEKSKDAPKCKREARQGFEIMMAVQQEMARVVDLVHRAKMGVPMDNDSPNDV